MGQEPVSAIASGTVITSQFIDALGWYVEINHGGGFVSQYADLYAQFIGTGAQVTQGQTIGFGADSGAGTGVHLHFRVLKDNSAYKPEPMSGVRGFVSYGDCTDVTSPSWFSRHPTDVQKVTNSSSLFNPGAKDDAVAFYQDTGTWFVAPSTGNNFFNHSPWIGAHGMGSTRQFAADVDANGYTDSVVWFAANGNWYVSLSNGSDYQEPFREWAAGHGVGSRNQFLTDVTGDNKADAVVYFEVGPSGYGQWFVWKSTATFPHPTFQPNPDFWTPWISGHGFGSQDQLLGDVNGVSGADAVAFFDSSGSWYVARSSGYHFQQPWSQWAGTHGQGSDRRFLADVNGGGWADAVTFVSGTGSWYVARSNGIDQFTPVNQLWASGHGQGSDNQMLGDVTGPGPGGALPRADAIVYFGQANGDRYVATSQGNFFSVPAPGAWWKHNYGNGS